MNAPHQTEHSIDPKARISAPPETSIRGSAPKVRGLPSRKVLMTGALVLGGMVAFALMTGLSRQDRSFGAARSETEFHAATPPVQVRDAPSAYGTIDLAAEGAANAAAPDIVGGPAPSSYPDLGDEGVSSGLPPASLGGGSRFATVTAAKQNDDGALEASRKSSILFGGDNLMRAASAISGKNSMVLTNRLQAPASRYILQAGAVIPAALRTAISSDAPGRVIAQVTAPVYDSITGEYLLIPQGARLLGAYDDGVHYGDRRVRIVWNRLILPNGWSIDLASMAATDQSGAAGLSAQVDDHLDRVVVASVLSGALSTAANSAKDKDSSFWAQSVGDAAAQEAARAGGRIVDRELEVRPSLRIKAGAKVRVLVERDLVLKVYSE